MAGRRGRFSLAAVAAAVQQSDSDSEFSNDNNPSESEYEEVIQDSNEDGSSGSEKASDVESEAGSDSVVSLTMSC